MFRLHLSGLLLAVFVVVANAQDPINQQTYNGLVNHWKYATSAYASSCPSPNGKLLISTFKNDGHKVYGYISRDDSAKEFVVAFRGAPDGTITSTVTGNTTLTKLKGPSIPTSWGQYPPNVHAGFLNAWLAVATTIQNTLDTEVFQRDGGKYSGYAVSSVGHNVGGAYAVLNTLNLRYRWLGQLPYTSAFTYGEPRMGDGTFAYLVDNVVGVSRVVHTNDGVPKLIPKGHNYTQYLHHPREFWIFKDPPTLANTEMCREYGDGENADLEDNKCSVSVNTNTVNGAHFSYFDIVYNTPFCSGGGGSGSATSTSTSTSPATTTQPPTAGLIRPVGDDRFCLAASSNTKGAKLVLAVCDGTSSLQKWSHVGKTYRVSGLCIDVTDGNDVKGTKVQLWSCGSGTNVNQQFVYEYQHLNWVGHGKSIDVTDGKYVAGAQLQIWTTSNTTINQKFGAFGI